MPNRAASVAMIAPALAARTRASISASFAASIGSRSSAAIRLVRSQVEESGNAMISSGVGVAISVISKL